MCISCVADMLANTYVKTLGIDTASMGTPCILEIVGGAVMIVAMIVSALAACFCGTKAPMSSSDGTINSRYLPYPLHLKIIIIFAVMCLAFSVRAHRKGELGIYLPLFQIQCSFLQRTNLCNSIPAVMRTYYLLS